MTEGLPFVGLTVGIMVAAMLILGLVAVTVRTIPSPWRESLGGLLLVLFIAYVVAGYGYALLTAGPSDAPDLACRGPPYTVC